MDEKTALKRTTATATKDQEWKKKKGYGPILVAVSLALLLSLYAGGHLGSGTNLPPSLHRDEKGMTNAVVSSSSTSLVGSGGSSIHCKKNTGYNCGAVFPPDGNTCDQKGCCCHQDDGGGDKLNTCDSARGYAYRGCNSCWGLDACFETNNVNIGTSSCHGRKACFGVEDSTIDNDSCHGASACSIMEDSTVGNESCLGTQPCDGVKNSVIGKGSCTDSYSCEDIENITIGNNSCNGDDVCYKCKHNVPDNACNQGITDDMDSDGFCNYCL